MNNYINCEARLIEFCDFEFDWNCNYAEPLSTAAVSNAFVLLEHLPDWGPKDWYIFPVAYKAGIVQFEFENDNIYIEIEVTGFRYEMWIYDNKTRNCVDDASYSTVRKVLKLLEKYKDQV